MSQFFAALQDRVKRRGSDPLITWYGPQNARMELSGITFANAVAKTAGMLIEELETQPGDTVLIRLPLHWQLPMWCAAADVAGLNLAIQELPSGQEPNFIVETDETGDPRYPNAASIVTSVSAFGLPMAGLPESTIDHARLAMGQPDVFLGEPLAGQLANHGGVWWASQEVRDAALAAADSVGLTTGGRLLCALSSTGPEVALLSWAAPLLLNATVVLVQSGDVTVIGHAEGSTATVL